jgi:hypothetical protein
MIFTSFSIVPASVCLQYYQIYFGKSGIIILKGLIQNKPLERIIESLPKKMKGSADIISAAIPASIHPGVFVLLESYLRLVENIDAGIKLPEGKSRKSLVNKSQEFKISTSGFRGQKTPTGILVHLILLRTRLYLISRAPRILEVIIRKNAEPGRNY